MAVKTKTTYKSTKDAAITTNGVGGISGADVSGIFENSADSFVFTTGSTTLSAATPLVLTAASQDVAITFNESSSGTNYTMGLDDTDSDSFKISKSTVLGSSDLISLGASNCIFDVTPVINNAGQGATGESTSMDISVDAGTDDLVTQIFATTATTGTDNILRMSNVNGNSNLINFKIDSQENALGFTDDGFFYLTGASDLATSQVLEVYTSGDGKLEWGTGLTYTAASVNARNFILANTSTGDVGMLYRASSQYYYLGIDNSESDVFNISVGTTLASNVVIQIDTSNNFILPSLPTSSAGLPTGAIWSNSGVLTIV